MDEQEISAKEYDNWLNAGTLIGKWIRFLMSPHGLFIHNTQAGKLFFAVPLRPGDRVLDIGGGYGSLLIYLHRKMPSLGRLDCLDISGQMVMHAKGEIEKRGLGERIVVTQGKASDLPYDTESFDVVLSSYMVKHLSDGTFRKMAAEAHRVLRPGGRFCLWDVGVAGQEWRVRLHKKLLSQEVSIIRLRTGSELRSVIAEAGFRELREFGRGFYILCPLMPRAGVIATKSRETS